jgi:hypothetical protein
MEPEAQVPQHESLVPRLGAAPSGGFGPSSFLQAARALPKRSPVCATCRIQEPVGKLVVPSVARLLGRDQSVSIPGIPIGIELDEQPGSVALTAARGVMQRGLVPGFFSHKRVLGPSGLIARFGQRLQPCAFMRLEQFLHITAQFQVCPTRLTYIGVSLSRVDDVQGGMEDLFLATLALGTHLIRGR